MAIQTHINRKCYMDTSIHIHKRTSIYVPTPNMSTMTYIHTYISGPILPCQGSIESQTYKMTHHYTEQERE